MTPRRIFPTSYLELVALCTAAAVAGCTDSKKMQSTLDAAGINATGGSGSICAAMSGTVHVCLNEQRATVPAFGLGIHTSVYDGSLEDPRLPGQLKQAGVSMLRYPGGGYADVYHWWNATLTPWGWNGTTGYLARGTDFGSIQYLVQAAAVSMMITVNYGSSRDGTTGGQPQEAAAWVAYANGSPDDPTVIGVDATGYDFKTVGYWATLRASAPHSTDDDLNFLRIAHPAPLGIEYWEIGNEVFGNGYYGSGTDFSEDLHAPYSNDSVDFGRTGLAALSPSAYGANVNAFARAMKAVDPSIKIGAVLFETDSWAFNWDDKVLAACGTNIDFGIVHFYPGTVTNNVVDSASLLASPRTIPQIAARLNGAFAAHVGRQLDWAVTEFAPRAAQVTDLQVRGLFAADAYVTFMEYGAINVDHLELHDSMGTFLSPGTSLPGPVFYAARMVHLFASPGDTLVSATPPTDNPTLVAHAALRQDDSVSVLLLNLDPNNASTFSVQIDGPRLAESGTRYDFVRTQSLNASDASGLGNQFEITVEPYAVTTIIIPPEGSAAPAVDASANVAPDAAQP